jgi:hypothetical protein
MEAAGLRTLQFQLDQVKIKLHSDPNNAALKSMAVKLESLIKLSQEDREDSVEAAPKKSVEKPKAKDSLKTTAIDSTGDFSGTKKALSADAASISVPEFSIPSCQESTTVPQTPAQLSQKNDSRSNTGPVRRKHTKAEHAQKKDVEHAVKQQSWQSFQQKLGGKAPLSNRISGSSTVPASSGGYKPSSGAYAPYSSNPKPK